MFPHQKVMFEIYRESGYDRLFRAVYYTELDEHHRDEEINRAAAGEPFYDGFLRESELPAAKKAVAALLERLNAGQPLTTAEAEAALHEFLA
jgi:hypothetical protein